MKIIGIFKEEESGGYTTNDPHSIIEFSQYFNDFWIFSNNTIDNAKLNIYINDKYEKTSNSDQLNKNTKSEDVLFSKVVKSTSHYNIKLEHGGISDQNLHIDYCYYLNDETINLNGIETETINVNAMKDHLTGDWRNEGSYLLSETKGSSITVNLNCCQFYIKCSRNSNNGNIDIILDGEEIDSISLYATKDIGESFVYKSPEKCGNHTLTLINHDDRKINITEIRYTRFSVEQSLINGLNGLINITCDKFDYSIDKDWVQCVHESGGDYGSYSGNQGAFANYTFNGTKVYVKATRENKRGIASIFIDNKFVSEVELHISSGKDSKIIYASEDLPFGEHSISVQNLYGNDAIIISAFIVDPLPKIGGYILGNDDYIVEAGTWTKNTGDTSYISSNVAGSSMIFKFHGTRFWLTGIRSKNNGNFDLFIDNNFVIECSEVTSGKYPNTAEGHKAILLYESDVYELKDHTVKIVKKDDTKTVSIVNLLYTTQPGNATYFLAKDMNIKGNWEPELEGGYSLIEPNSAFEFSRYFNHLWILGRKTNDANDQAPLNIYSNDQFDKKVDINELGNSLNSKEILFSLIDKSVYSYDVKLENGGDLHESLHIDYCYYLNDKEIIIKQPTTTININEITNNEGKWKTTNNNKNIYSETKDSSITVNFLGSRFWISGDVDPYYGIIDIIFDDQLFGTVSLYNEKHDSKIFYESPPDIEYGQHILVISNHDNRPININEIKYNHIPPTSMFSYSVQFTNSFFFSKTDCFSKTRYFTETNDFSNSIDFTNSKHFTVSDEFEKSNIFSTSFFFSKSNDFTKSNLFSETNDFTNSKYFSKSDEFTESFYFTNWESLSRSEEILSSSQEDSSTEVIPSSTEEIISSSGEEEIASSSGEITSSSGEEITSSSGEEITSSSEEEITSSSGEEITSSSEEEITSSSGEEITSSSGEEITSSSGEEIISSSSEEITSSSEEEITSSSGEEITSSSEEEITSEKEIDDVTSSLETSTEKSSSDDVSVPASNYVSSSISSLSSLNIQTSGPTAITNDFSTTPKFWQTISETTEAIFHPITDKPGGEVSKSGGKKNLSLIIGLVVGIIAVIIIIVLIIIFIIYKRRKEKDNEATSENMSNELSIVGKKSDISNNDSFDNPLFQADITRIEKDPFDQEMEEDI